MSSTGQQGTSLGRRRFLEACGAAGSAGAALASAGCLHRLAHTEGLDPGSIERSLHHWERSLASVDELSVVSQIVGRLCGPRASGSFGRDGYLAGADEVARRLCRTLLATGLYYDLPRSAIGTDEIRQRIQLLGPTLDEAMTEAAQILSQSQPEDLDFLERSLDESPSLVMEIAGHLDEMACGCGLGRHGRLRHRRLSRALSERLGEVGPRQVIDEVLEGMGEVVDHLIAQGATVQGGRPRQSSKPAGTAKERQYRNSGRNILIGGAITSGVGVATGLAGLGALIGHSDVSIGLFSIGGLNLVIAIIILIVGGVRRARERRDRQVPSEE